MNKRYIGYADRFGNASFFPAGKFAVVIDGSKIYVQHANGTLDKAYVTIKTAEKFLKQKIWAEYSEHPFINKEYLRDKKGRFTNRRKEDLNNLEIAFQVGEKAFKAELDKYKGSYAVSLFLEGQF